MRLVPPHRIRLAPALIREQYCNAISLASYIDASLVHRDNVEWLFILTFPNGGSTAFAKFLLTADGTVSLGPNAEGQWLIPSLSSNVSRWDSNLRVSWRKIRAVWLHRIRDKSKKVIVIEKSPPNLCRYEQLLDAFRSMKTYVVTFTRDPYATCASWHRRYGYDGIVSNWGGPKNMTISNEMDYFSWLGEIWLSRAKMLLEARRISCLHIRYEDFAEDPVATLDKIASAIPMLGTADGKAVVSVKDYGSQPIRNMNEQQTAILSVAQRNAIYAALSRDSWTVQALGYSIG